MVLTGWRHHNTRRAFNTFGVLSLMWFLSVMFALQPALSQGAELVDSQVEVYVPKNSVVGAMTIAGSDTMKPVLAKLALLFRQHHPNLKIVVQGSSDTTKFTAEQIFISGISSVRRGDGGVIGHSGAYDVQLLALSRELTEAEISTFVSRYGYQPVAIPIAQDGIAIYVHRDNPIERLTLEQVDAVFSASHLRGLPGVDRWGQLGLGDSWENASINLYGRDERSRGTAPFFKTVVLLGGEFKATVKAQPGSASVVMAVGRDKYGIGYSGIGFQTSGVRPVPLAEKNSVSFILPTAESVMSRQYPLSRQLYLYANRNPQKEFDAKILEFLRYANSREGQEAVARSGVYPLTAAQVAKNLALLTPDDKTH